MVIAFRSNSYCFWEIWAVPGSIPRVGTWFFFFVQINYFKFFMYVCISYNDKKELKLSSNLLKITLKFWTVWPNHGADFLWVRHDGKLMYQERLKITVYCPFDFGNFPFDSHKCNLNMYWCFQLFPWPSETFRPYYTLQKSLNYIRRRRYSYRFNSFSGTIWPEFDKYWTLWCFWK